MSPQSIRIAHISDPHFGTTTSEKRAILETTLQDLAPELIVISGDITQRALSIQFQEARQFCESLIPIEILAVPGNHDIPLFNLPARLFWPYHSFTRYFKSPLISTHRMGGIEVMGLNSTCRFRHIQGQLGSSGKRALSGFSADSLFRIVVIHHPLDCPKEVDEKNILRDADQAIPYFENAKVDLVLSGHIHDPLARLTLGRYPKMNRPMANALAGTCLSSRTRAGAPNSFNLVEIKIESENAELAIIRYDLSKEGTYYPKNRSEFKRQGRDNWGTA